MWHGRYEVKIKALLDGPDHPTLLSFQGLLAMDHIESTVRGSKMWTNSEESEYLSIEFACYCVSPCARKRMHLAVATGKGEPNIAKAKLAANKNPAPGAVLADVLEIGLADTVEALRAMGLTTPMALVMIENIVSKWARRLSATAGFPFGTRRKS